MILLIIVLILVLGFALLTVNGTKDGATELFRQALGKTTLAPHPEHPKGYVDPGEESPAPFMVEQLYKGRVVQSTPLPRLDGNEFIFITRDKTLPQAAAVAASPDCVKVVEVSHRIPFAIRNTVSAVQGAVRVKEGKLTLCNARGSGGIHLRRSDGGWNTVQTISLEELAGREVELGDVQFRITPTGAGDTPSQIFF